MIRFAVQILQGLDVLPSTVQASMSGIHIPAASLSEVLIKAQYPSVHASPSLPQQATADSTQLISQQLSAPTGQTAALSGEAAGEAAVQLPHQQSNTISETVSLSEMPEAEQLAMHSAPVLAQPASTPETGSSAVNAEAASQRAEESNASVRDIAQGDMLESHSTAVVQPTSLVGPNISTELSDHPLLSQPIQTGSIQLSAASDMQNHLTGKQCCQSCIDAGKVQSPSNTPVSHLRALSNTEEADCDSPWLHTGSPAHSTKAPALQEEHSSLSGFHTPSSQPVSRVQSATSSDAFFDSSSQITSRTASITSSTSTAVSSLNSLASSRRPVPGTRQSTRDLIGALRQQAGLPPPDAFLSPPDDQEKTVVLPAVQQSIVADSSTTASPAVALVESQLQPVVLMPQTPSTVSAEALTLAVPVAASVTGQTASAQGASGGTAQERQSVVLQTETSGISGGSAQVSAMSTLKG